MYTRLNVSISRVWLPLLTGDSSRSEVQSGKLTVAITISLRIYLLYRRIKATITSHRNTGRRESSSLRAKHLAPEQLRVVPQLCSYAEVHEDRPLIDSCRYF